MNAQWKGSLVLSTCILLMISFTENIIFIANSVNLICVDAFCASDFDLHCLPVYLSWFDCLQ